MEEYQKIPGPEVWLVLAIGHEGDEPLAVFTTEAKAAAWRAAQAGKHDLGTWVNSIPLDPE